MNPRPQFSLRMLLFVTALVCLAAATVSPTHNSDQDSFSPFVYRRPVPMPLAMHAQGALRVALSFALPALLIAGAVRPRRYISVFCVGAIWPALAGLTMFCLQCDFFFEGLHKYVKAYGARGVLVSLDGLWKALPKLRYEHATAWVLGLVCGLIAVVVERVLPASGEGGGSDRAFQRRRCACRVLLILVGMLALAGLVMAKPPRTMPSLRVRELLIITLSLALQGVLTAGAVRSRKTLRAFYMGAALASCLAWAIVCHALHFDAINRGNPFAQIRPVIWHHYSLAAAWLFAPLFGLTCAFLHWLFRSSPDEEDC